MILTKCPYCDSKERLRPFGCDVLTGSQGGCYFKYCEVCNTGIALSRDKDEITFKGTLEDLHIYQEMRRKQGKR